MRQVPRVLRSRKGALFLAAIVVALLVEASTVLAGASPLSRYSHAVRVSRTALAPGSTSTSTKPIVGHAVAYFRTAPLRSLPPAPSRIRPEHEASPNPLLASRHRDAADPVVQHRLARPNMPAPTLKFDGI